jgi:hypothetical protein
MPAIGGAGDRFEFEFSEKGLSAVGAKIKVAEERLARLEHQANETDRALKDVGSHGAGGIRGVTRDMDGLDRQSRRSHQGVRGLDGAVRDMGQALRVVQAPAAVAGLAALAGAASSAGGAAVGLVAALAPVAGAVAALPGLAAAGGQAFGVFKLAILGVGEALKAMSDAEKTSGADAAAAAKAREAAAERQRAAANRVRDATIGVRDAEESSADRVASATEQVRSAKQRLISTQEDAKRAQEDLTRARVDARAKLQDLREEAEKGALSEERASLDVERARQRIIEVAKKGAKASSLDRHEADLSYREAVASLEEIRHRRADAAKEFHDAQKRGVNGSREVVAAQERVRDAAKSVGEAHRDVGKAQAGVSKAQREGAQQVAKAQTALADAITEQRKALQDLGVKGSSSAAKVGQALAALSPAGQKFTRFLFGLRPELKALQAAAQSGFLPGLQTGIQHVNKLFPLMKTAVSDTAVTMGDLAREGGELLSSGPWRDDFRAITKSSTVLIGDFGHAGLDLMKALKDVTVAAIPMTNEFGRMTAAGAKTVATFTAHARATGDLRDFFIKTVDTTKILGSILGDVGVVLWEIGKAALPLGTGLLKTFEKLADNARQFFTSTEGRAELQDFFTRIQPVLDSVGRIITLMAKDMGNSLNASLHLSEKLAEIGKQHPALERVAAAASEIALLGKVTGIGGAVGPLLTLATKAGPLGGVGLAIAGIGAAAGIAYLENEDFRKSVDDLFNDLKTGWTDSDAKRLQTNLTKGLTPPSQGVLNGEDFGHAVTRSWRDVWESNLKPALDDAKKKFGQVHSAWNDFMKGFNTEETGKITNFAQNLGAFAQGLTQLAGDVKRATAGAYHWLDDMAMGLQHGADAATKKVHDAVVGWFKRMVAGVKDFLGINSPSTVFAGIGRDIIAGLLAGVKERWAGAYKWMTGIPAAAARAIRDFGPKITTVATAGWNAWTAKAKAKWEEFKGWAKGIPGSAAATIRGFGSRITTVAATGWNAWTAASKTKWEGFKAWAKGIPLSAAQTIGAFGTRLREVAGTGWSAFLAQGKSAWATIKNWLLTLPGNAAVAMRGLGPRIGGVFKSAFAGASRVLNSFTTGIQRISDKLGSGKLGMPKMPELGGPGGDFGGGTFARGGPVLSRRGGGGVPYSKGVRGKDSVTIRATPGEYVMTPEMVNAVPGGMRTLEGWRHASNATAPARSRIRSAGLPGEARGGQLAVPRAVGGRIAGLVPSFLAALRAYSAGIGRDLTVGSGFRTRAEQAALYRAKPGLAAPPGRSHHEQGLAADISPQLGGTKLGNPAAARYGLRFPMSWEPWHIEPTSLRGGRASVAGGGGGGIDAGPLLRGLAGPLLARLGKIPGAPGKLAKAGGQQILDAAIGHLSAGGGGGGPGGVTVGGGKLSAAEAWIIGKESGGRTSADNPSSTAFGLGQLLISNRRRYAARLGVSPGTTDYNAQLKMFRMYVKERYGTPERAKAFWQAHGWYGAGGPVQTGGPAARPMARGMAAGGLVGNARTLFAHLARGKPISKDFSYKGMPKGYNPAQLAKAFYASHKGFKFSSTGKVRARIRSWLRSIIPAPAPANIYGTTLEEFIGRKKRAPGGAPIVAKASLASSLEQAFSARASLVQNAPSVSGNLAMRWYRKPAKGVTPQSFYMNDVKDKNRGKSGYIQSSRGTWQKGTRHQIAWRTNLWNRYKHQGLTKRLMSYAPGRAPAVTGTGGVTPKQVYRPRSGGVPGGHPGGKPTAGVSIGTGAVQVHINASGGVDEDMVQRVVTNAFRDFAGLIEVRGA